MNPFRYSTRQQFQSPKNLLKNHHNRNQGNVKLKIFCALVLTLALKFNCNPRRGETRLKDSVERETCFKDLSCSREDSNGSNHPNYSWIFNFIDLNNFDDFNCAWNSFRSFIKIHPSNDSVIVDLTHDHLASNYCICRWQRGAKWFINFQWVHWYVNTLHNSLWRLMDIFLLLRLCTHCSCVICLNKCFYDGHVVASIRNCIRERKVNSSEGRRNLFRDLHLDGTEKSLSVILIRRRWKRVAALTNAILFQLVQWREEKSDGKFDAWSRFFDKLRESLDSN